MAFLIVDGENCDFGLSIKMGCLFFFQNFETVIKRMYISQARVNANKISVENTTYLCKNMPRKHNLSERIISTY